MSISKDSLTINGEVYNYTFKFTVVSLLEYLGFKTDVLVVDYNGTILPREFWSQTEIKNKDTIELLTVAGGG
jgi:sulfur carrier protein